MDTTTLLYGLLGLSLFGNAVSLVNLMIDGSKKRDEDNQRTISSVYEELNDKIDDETHRIWLRIEELSDEILDSREDDSVYNHAEPKGCCKMKKRS